MYIFFPILISQGIALLGNTAIDGPPFVAGLRLNSTVERNESVERIVPMRTNDASFVSHF